MSKIIKTTFLFLIGMTFLPLQGCNKGEEIISPKPKAKEETKNISLDNENIHVTGAAYIFRSPIKLFYKRFSEEVLNAPAAIRRFDTNVALSTSGISIQFKTKSPFIHLTFSPETGLNEKGAFKILKDGTDFQTITFDGPINQPIQIKLSALPTDKEYVYEIILPSYANLSLTKLEIDGDSDLVAYTPKPKRVYIGFGDSITHGRGQDGCTFLTYPYLLAQKLGMTLYNLGIGGARISIPVATMSKDLPQADLITILIGFNDFESANQTQVQFEANYRAYLTEIRANHPSAAIYCITLLHTTRTSNTTTGLTPEHFRNIVKEIVSEYQMTDNNLHLIEGDKITSAKHLTDRVHLNVEGASTLAEELYHIISPKF